MAERGWERPIRASHSFAAGIPWCKRLLTCFYGCKYSQVSPFSLSVLDAILWLVRTLIPTIWLRDRIILHISQSGVFQKSFIHLASILVFQFSAVVCIIARDSWMSVDVSFEKWCLKALRRMVSTLKKLVTEVGHYLVLRNFEEIYFPIYLENDFFNLVKANR